MAQECSNFVYARNLSTRTESVITFLWLIRGNAKSYKKNSLPESKNFIARNALEGEVGGIAEKL